MFLKFRLSEKHTKFEKNLPNGFDKSVDLLSKRQNHEEDFSNYVCFSKSLNFNKIPFHKNIVPYRQKKWVFQFSDTTKMHLFKKQHMRLALSISKCYLVFYLNFNFVVKHCARKKHNIMSFKKTK